MKRVTLELIAACVAISSAFLVLRLSLSPDGNVAFFIALIVALTVWEASRLLLRRVMAD
jgi:hypothetical protein